MNTNPTRSLSEHITEALSNLSENYEVPDRVLTSKELEANISHLSDEEQQTILRVHDKLANAHDAYIVSVTKIAELIKKRNANGGIHWDDIQPLIQKEAGIRDKHDNDVQAILNDLRKHLKTKNVASLLFALNESVNEAKMSKQDTESFTVDYDNMGGGLNCRIDFQLWGADEIAIELGHYSGGRNIRFKMDSKSAQKLLDAKAKQRKMTADLKIGERIPDEQLAEYMALENELSIELTQNLALDLKNVASAYEKEIAKVLSKYGFKL